MSNKPARQRNFSAVFHNNANTRPPLAFDSDGMSGLHWNRKRLSGSLDQRSKHSAVLAAVVRARPPANWPLSISVNTSEDSKDENNTN